MSLYGWTLNNTLNWAGKPIFDTCFLIQVIENQVLCALCRLAKKGVLDDKNSSLLFSSLLWAQEPESLQKIIEGNSQSSLTISFTDGDSLKINPPYSVSIPRCMCDDLMLTIF